MNQGLYVTGSRRRTSTNYYKYQPKEPQNHEVNHQSSGLHAFWVEPVPACGMKPSTHRSCCAAKAPIPLGLHSGSKGQPASLVGVELRLALGYCAETLSSAAPECIEGLKRPFRGFLCLPKAYHWCGRSRNEEEACAAQQPTTTARASLAPYSPCLIDPRLILPKVNVVMCRHVSHTACCVLWLLWLMVFQLLSRRYPQGLAPYSQVICLCQKSKARALNNCSCLCPMAWMDHDRGQAALPSKLLACSFGPQDFVRVYAESG